MSLRVLIAEDELLIALSLQKQMESQGHHVVAIAGSGDDALRLCRARDPEMVFMDIRMPGMDGITATRRLMEECPHPTIIVTANAEGRAEAERAGAMEYAVKPLLSERIPLVIAKAQERYARYLLVRAEEGACPAALEAWPVVQEAIVRAVAGRGLSEEEAFACLRAAAKAGGRTLRQEAAQELAS